MSETIPLSSPTIKGNEWKYIKECLDTEWVSSVGRYVDLFETRILEYTGSKNAISCVNGTAALFIALKLAGVKESDEVIVPTLTFIATVNAVRYLNADPVFMDSDRFYNIDVEKTIQFIREETRFENGIAINKSTGKKVTAIIPVHVFGNAANLEGLLDICCERNIKIVEDATESLGTKYISGKLSERHCGTIGDLGCLSFNGNKIITTGGGGMILTDDPKMAEKARYLTTQAKDDPIHYIHHDIGYNFRLTNIQSAMGVAQLEQLATFLKKKKDIKKKYAEKINPIPGLHIVDSPEYADNNHWLNAIKIDKAIYGKDREEVMDFLRLNHIESRPVWQLNHFQKPYKKYQSYKIENAYRLLEKTLNIPSSVGISQDQINLIVKVLSDV